MARRSAVLLVVALLCAVTVGCAAGKGPLGSPQRLSFGGQSRSYVMHVPPSYTGRRAVPLVVLLHGATAAPEWVEKESAFSVRADREGFIVVYPVGSPPSNRSGRGRPGGGGIWNSGGLGGWAPSVDDVGFIRAVVKEVQRRYRIDPKRIYAAGMSNGGMMAQRLGAEASDVFAAVAAVAGTLNVACPAGRPMPVVMVHGLKDNMVPFDGGRGGPFHLASVPDSVQAWAKRNGGKPAPQRTDKGSVMTERYTGGKDGAEVLLYITKDGQHAWPHAEGKAGRGGLEATDVIWVFFERHPKR